MVGVTTLMPGELAVDGVFILGVAAAAAASAAMPDIFPP